MTRNHPNPIASAEVGPWLRWQLSQPPSATGRRLLPQRELATRLGTNRNWIRRAVQELVEQGILVNRQGSGTFVRRVPSPDEAPAPTGKRATPSAIFATESEEKRLRLPATAKALKLELWTDLHWPAPSRKLLIAGMRRQAVRLGHELLCQGATTKAGKPLSAHSLQARIATSDADGFFVHDSVALAVMPILATQSRPFAVIDAQGVIQHEPTVLSNLDEAVERAVGQLAAAGHQRIALLSFAGNKDADVEAFRYQRARQRLGLTFDCCQRAEFAHGQAQRTMAELLALPEPPEAIYLADDNLLPGVVAALVAAGKRIGPGGFGVITMSIKGLPMPDDREWSRFEFDPQRFGECVVNTLVSRLREASEAPLNQAFHLGWCPGTSHLR